MFHPVPLHSPADAGKALLAEEDELEVEDVVGVGDWFSVKDAVFAALDVRPSGFTVLWPRFL